MTRIERAQKHRQVGGMFCLFLLLLLLIRRFWLGSFFIGIRDASSGSNAGIAVHPHHGDRVVDWRNRFYIFIGGYHHSGTSVMERLLSSQQHSTGLFVDLTLVNDTSSCDKVSSLDKRKCIAPEREGEFVTKEFFNYYIHRKTMCARHAQQLWGQCASKLQLTEEDITKLPHGPIAFRRQLLQDWSAFWDVPNNQYLVEKDIANIVKSRFLQALFGSTRTAFVFAIRHPLYSCRNFKCNLSAHVQAWLDVHKMLLRDTSYLSNFIIYHHEGLLEAPKKLTEQIRSLLGWRNQISYLDGTNKPPITRKVLYSEIADHMNKYDVKVAPTIWKEEKIGKEGMHKEMNASESTTKVPKFVRRENSTTLEIATSASLREEHSSNATHIEAPYLLRKGRRRLGFHGDESQFTSRKYQVELRMTSETVAWMKEYPTQIFTQSKKTYATFKSELEEYEAALNEFCYTIYSLMPTCKNGYIFKRGSSSLRKQDRSWKEKER